MSALVDALQQALGGDPVSDRPIDGSRLSHDASHYLLRPQAVVLARETGDVARAVAVAREHGVGVTFRSGGTSLSGRILSLGTDISIFRLIICDKAVAAFPAPILPISRNASSCMGVNDKTSSFSKTITSRL